MAKVIKFTGIHAIRLHIAKWSITAIYCDDENITHIDCGECSYQVKETVEEALRLRESTE